jgi:hypothetical protein
LKIIIFFNLLSMGLSRSYDPGRGFDRLIQVVFLGPFLIDFFFQFHSSTLS